MSAPQQGAPPPRGWDALFDELVELAPAARRERLAALSDGNPTLVAFLQKLLRADEVATALPSAPLLARAPNLVTEALGAALPALDEERIGPYRILGPLGSGGMGEVFLAERADGEFEQRVAIKRIRGDVAASGFLERFRRERQILAGLEHPGIARLLDGGRTAEGAPYIVLELVEGEPITAWCRRTGAGLETRLRLLRETASAVDAAHRRLIVHRDLKPSNLLVTADGRPKLLDFGIAKILSEVSAEAGEAEGRASTETGLQGGPLTPSYAAPEQILGEAVTTATDVFSLGALLYELLAGKPPFPRQGRTLHELARGVESETFTRPSQVAHEVDDAAIRAFVPRLGGDLDTIVAKALHRDPARRYPSAAALADDIDRFLDGRPVSARPDSVRYRFGKLVRRHRVAFAAGAAGLLLALASAVGFGMRLAAERDVARHEAARADEARREAERVSGFVVGLFAEANPSTSGAHEPTAREILDRGGQRVARELAEEQAVRVRLETAIAEAYLGLLRPTEALRHVAAARAAQAQSGGTEPVATGRLLVAEARARLMGNDDLRAEAASRQAISLIASAQPGDGRLLAAAMGTLSGSLFHQGRYADAERALRREMTILAPEGPTDADLLDSQIKLGGLLRRQGRYDEAARELRAVLAQIAGRDDRLRQQVDAALTLGVVLRSTSDFAGAEQQFRQGLALAERLDGPQSPGLVDALVSLGFLAAKRGDLEAALGFYRRAQKIVEEAQLGSERPLEGIGDVLEASGRFDEAAAVYETVLAHNVARQGPASSDIAWNLYALGRIEKGRGRRDAARIRLERSLAAFEASVGPQQYWVSWPLHELGLLALEAGDAAQAVPLLERALSLRQKGLAPGRAEIAETRAALERARRLAAASPKRP